MIRTLLRKELAAHWLPLLGLFLMAASVLLLFMLGGVRDDSVFSGFRMFLLTAAPIVAYGVSSRIVAQEYTGRTQLFLETLPVSRLQVLTIKLLLGGVVFLGGILGATAITVLVNYAHAEPTGTALRILFCRVVVYALFLHSTCFLLNLLGRYRIACLLLMLVGFMVVDQETSIDVESLGPFALVDRTLGFERHVLALGDVGWTLLGAAGALALAFGLATVREGSVAAMLGHRMSHREKAFVAAGIIFTLALSLAVGDKLPGEPFDIPGAVAAQAEGIDVQVAPGAELSEEEATELAHWTRDELVALRDFLGVADLPSVFVVPWPGLDGDRYEVGTVEDAEGLIMRVHPADPAWTLEQFSSWLASEVLIARTRGRVLREGKRWLHDGFGPYWARRGREVDGPWDLAAYAAPEGIRVADLDGWNRFREQVGVDLAREVACSGLHVLAEERGEEALRSLVRGVVTADVPQDVRALFHPASAPLSDIFATHCGIAYDPFVERWSEQLAAVGRARASEIARIPRLTAGLSFGRVSDLSWELRFRLEAHPPLDGAAEVEFRWAEVGPFNIELQPNLERIHTVSYEAAAAGCALYQLLPEGGRVAWRMSAKVQGVNAELSTGWRREEVR